MLVPVYVCSCTTLLSCVSPVNRRMDQWIHTSDLDLDTVEMQLEEVGPDGK
jgi:hypothetical protein